MIRFNFKWLIMSLVLIGLFLAFYVMGRRSNADEISTFENILRVEKQKSKVWEDNAGHWHNKAEAAEIKSNEAFQYLAKYDERFASLSKDFEGVKKSLKNVEYVGFTGTQSSYTLKTTSRDTLYVMGQDTTLAKYFQYKDSTGWFSASGVMLKNGMVPYLNFQSRDSLVTVMTKNKKLFRRATFSQEIKSYNPHTKIVYNQSVLVHRRKKFLGIF